MNKVKYIIILFIVFSCKERTRETYAQNKKWVDSVRHYGDSVSNSYLDSLWYNLHIKHYDVRYEGGEIVTAKTHEQLVEEKLDKIIELLEKINRTDKYDTVLHQRNWLKLDKLRGRVITPDDTTILRTLRIMNVPQYRIMKDSPNDFKVYINMNKVP